MDMGAKFSLVDIALYGNEGKEDLMLGYALIQEHIGTPLLNRALKNSVVVQKNTDPIAESQRSCYLLIVNNLINKFRSDIEVKGEGCSKSFNNLYLKDSEKLYGYLCAAYEKKSELSLDNIDSVAEDLISNSLRFLSFTLAVFDDKKDEIKQIIKSLGAVRLVALVVLLTMDKAIFERGCFWEDEKKRARKRFIIMMPDLLILCFALEGQKEIELEKSLREEIDSESLKNQKYLRNFSSGGLASAERRTPAKLKMAAYAEKFWSQDIKSNEKLCSFSEMVEYIFIYEVAHVWLREGTYFELSVFPSDDFIRNAIKDTAAKFPQIPKQRKRRTPEEKNQWELKLAQTKAQLAQVKKL